MVATQWHFRRAAPNTIVDSRVCKGDVYDAPRGNGWQDAALARALGLGLLLGMPHVDLIPVRHFGGRTAVLVRSVLRRCDTMVF